jgi:hypothetical protein|tara:strand:- start:9010 stop:9570 length:561 start_codon:yes stop_codon:yes gene_type:complete
MAEQKELNITAAVVKTKKTVAKKAAAKKPVAKKPAVKKVSAKKAVAKKVAKKGPTVVEQVSQSVNKAAMVYLGVVGETLDSVEANVEKYRAEVAKFRKERAKKVDAYAKRGEKVKAKLASRIDSIETPKFEAPTVESLKADFTKAQASVKSEVEKAQAQAKEELAKLQASVEETVETVKGRFKKAA